MPWPAGTPAWLKNQWGVLSGQASARATTAELFAALAPAAAAAPGGYGPSGALIVGQLRSVAVKIRSASEAITRDGLTGTITAEHIAEAPWSRSPVQQSLTPRYMVRALVTAPSPEAVAGITGVPQSIEQWVTLYMAALPGTLDELVEQVIQHTAETGSPPVPVTGVTKMEILRE